MGKRKKASKPQTKKLNRKLPTSFQCLFCNHESSVTVKLDKKIGIGHLQCKVCGQSFQSGINYLSANVDIYYDWVDACEKAAKEAGEDDEPAPRSSAPRPKMPRSKAKDLDDEEDEDDLGGYADGEKDGFVVDDEEDAEGEFADDD